MVGAAVGGYRDEFEAVCPDLKDASRAELTDEGMPALRALFDDARASFRGKHFHFEDVESFPKPVQPIYSGGNSDGSLRRAAELCQGWMPSKVGPDQVRQKRAVLDGYARAAGRDPAQITTALASVVCIGDTPAQAREILDSSAFGLFRTSVEKTSMKGVDMDSSIFQKGVHW